MTLRTSLNTYRHFHRVLSQRLPLNDSKFKTIKSTVDQISHSDLPSSQSFKDLINHHHQRLSGEVKEAEREYEQLYNLTVKLSKLLDTSPLVAEEDKRDILNLLIQKFSKYNYGASTLALNSLGNDKKLLSHVAAAELVQNNPGRVNSSYQLYKQLKPESDNHDVLAVAALNKLVFGDPVEIKEGLADITIDKLIQILEVYSNIGEKDLIPEDTLIKLVQECFRLEVSAVITQLTIPSKIYEEIISKNEDLKGIDCLYMYESSISNGVSLSGNSILKIFTPISRLLLRDSLPESDNLEQLKQKINFSVPELAPLTEIVDELREQILELGLDEEFKVKLDLIKSAAFHSKDFAKAIYYFQNYQTQIPDGTPAQNDLKSTVSLAAVFECIESNSDKMITVAEALVPQTPLPAANNLAGLILYHGWFGDSDKAFDIYNQSLDLYMKPLEGNEPHRGVLVQALTTVSLLGREVGLAKLIKQKSVENKLIDDSWEARLTNLMKDYGDVIEESGADEIKFRTKMKTVFLNQIISIAP